VTYVFDGSPLSTLHRNYYRDIFPTLWVGFDKLVEDGEILSTREVLRELRRYNLEPLLEWAKANEDLFPTPNREETAFVARIFEVRHFQNNIEGKKLLSGGYVADPFIIARAAVTKSTVVSMETFKENSADIPNICEHFEIPHFSLAQFMKAESWKF
jgi:hypothetical protein